MSQTSKSKDKYKCQSYFENGITKDCSCGKCSQSEEETLRVKFHSFWNNHLYGDGDCEPSFPSYAEIQDFWLREIKAKDAERDQAVVEEREKFCVILKKLYEAGDSRKEMTMEYFQKIKNKLIPPITNNQSPTGGDSKNGV